MFWRFRRSFVAWCLVVAWLLPSFAPLSVGGSPRKKKGARKGRASGVGSKGDFVMGVVPPDQSPTAVASVPRQGKILAVVIGVGKFQQTGIRPLRYPAKDAADFAAWLRSVGVPSQNIALLTDKKATFKAVNRTLRAWLRKQATSRFDDIVLFFSGHGVKDGQLYWLLHDSELDNLDASALRRDLLHKNISQMRVKNKLLFVDACYSRATSTPPGSQDMVAQKNQLLPGEALRGFGGQGSFSLFSSDGDQESLEPASLGNGLFTYWLLRGLKGEADASKDGVLTATELYSFVAAKVREASAGYGKPQDPAQDDKTVGGQLALLRFPSAAPPTPVASASSSGSSASQGTRLRVESTPAGASIYLDGAKEGQTPWEAEVEPGRRTLELKLDGYSPVKEVLRLRKHQRRTESYTLRAIETPARREEPAPVPAPREEPEAVVPPPPRPRTPKPGQQDTFKAKGQTFKVRYIPAGSFTMGSPDEEKERRSDEGPQRQVTLTKGFWMLETEVTQAQYKALVGSNPSRFKNCGKTCPVEQVSWHDAAAWANKLSQDKGLETCFTCNDKTCDIPDKATYLACKGWRLPTEAEWEYAARAGTTTRFHTGDCITPAQANFDGNSPPEGCSKGEYRNKPVAVESFPANDWGLRDMQGNVWEWVADWYKDSYDSSDLENPLQLLESNPSGRSDRVLRGGSWNCGGWRLRSAYRRDIRPADRYSFVGFRLLRSL